MGSGKGNKKRVRSVFSKKEVFGVPKYISFDEEQELLIVIEKELAMQKNMEAMIDALSQTNSQNNSIDKEEKKKLNSAYHNFRLQTLDNLTKLMKARMDLHNHQYVDVNELINKLESKTIDNFIDEARDAN